MTKKLLAIFLVICMALSITACGGEKNNGKSSTAEVTNTLSETTASSETTTATSETTTAASETTTAASETATEMETIEPPADGWTPELLNQVMYLNGKPFSLPCTLKDLGEGYSFSENITDWKDDTGTCELLYNKEIVATVGLNNYSDSKGVSDNSKITGMIFDRAIISDLKNGFDIKKCSINGVFLDSTREEITQQMGVPTLHNNEDFYHYYYKDTTKARVDFMFGIEGEDSLDQILIANY